MFYITTPIPYTNSNPHIGHLLEAVFADTLRRFYLRTESGGVFLAMGADQHGLKIFESAKEKGQTPEVFVENLSKDFLNLYQKFEIGYSDFIKTSSQRHRLVASLVWQKLQEKGYIYKKSYDGLYCKGCEDFYAPTQLVHGKCPIHHIEPISMSEENYFFKLSDFEKPILDFLQDGNIIPDFMPLEQINFVKEGLLDISISREKSRLPWGVPVPGDTEQVMYVWFEALLYYLSAVINSETVDVLLEFPEQIEIHADAVWQDINEAFPIDIMYIGKEIAKFHLVIFIAILSALELPLPKKTLAHGLINDENGHKFSKSAGNGVTPTQMIEKFGIEGTRFLLLHDINISGDTAFSWENMTASYNANLANNLGNLAMRVTTLIEKNCDGMVEVDTVTEQDKLFDFAGCYADLANLNPKNALEKLLQGARLANEYLENQKPWTLIKEGNYDQAKIVLTKLAVFLVDLSEVLSISMPETGEKIYKQITADQITKMQILFAKIED
jgi:methionyl-tRNA synthetase